MDKEEVFLSGERVYHHKYKWLEVISYDRHKDVIVKDPTKKNSDTLTIPQEELSFCLYDLRLGGLSHNRKSKALYQLCLLYNNSSDLVENNLYIGRVTKITTGGLFETAVGKNYINAEVLDEETIEFLVSKKIVHNG